MSDDWRYFMCQMGEHLASIMVDVGIAKSIDSTPHQLAQLRLVYKEPADNGLPTNAEFKTVSAVEDRLNEAIAGTADVFVGRFTTQGYRQFHVYTTHDAGFWGEFAQRIANEFGYTMQVNVEEDRERSGYWQAVYPTPDDWQVIKDMGVCQQLEKSGDNSDIERQIDHWLYFPNEAAANRFVAWAASSRFMHDPQYSGPQEGGKFCVRVHHNGPTYQRNVSNHTIELRRKAEEFGGEYDGWETRVEKLESHQPPT